jgi:hypothetical protein
VLGVLTFEFLMTYSAILSSVLGFLSSVKGLIAVSTFGASIFSSFLSSVKGLIAVSTFGASFGASYGLATS